jgi:hypothetical protein
MNTPTTKMNDMEVTKPRPAKEVKIFRVYCKSIGILRMPYKYCRKKGHITVVKQKKYGFAQDELQVSENLV